MHPQQLFGLLLAVLLGTSTALVLPKSNPIPRDVTKVTSGSSNTNTDPANTPIYYPSPAWSGQLSPNNKQEKASGTHSEHISEGGKDGENMEEHSSIYRRDGGGSNMTAIYAIIPVFVVGFLIFGCLCWRKFQGH